MKTKNTSTVHSEPPPFPQQGSSRTNWVEVLVVGFLFLLLTIFYLAPAMFDCDLTIMGGPGDATSGGVWLGWQYQKLNSGPWLNRTPYLNAPYEQPVFDLHLMSSMVLFSALWVVNKVLSPVCSWNMMILVGFLATSMVTYGFLKWLTGNRFASVFCAYAYAFSPFHLIKAQGHLAYVHSEFLVAVIWLSLLVWVRPTRRTSVALAVAIAFLFYTDGYYILLGGAAILGFSVAGLFQTATIKEERAKLKPRVLALGSAGLIVALLCSPLLFTLFTQGASIAGTLGRGEHELFTYGARLHEFVLPPRMHPFFGPRLGAFQDVRLHGSNYSEQTLFLGWSISLLAVGACVVAFKRKTLRDSLLPSRLSLRASLWFLGSISVISLVVSGPSPIEIFGVEIRWISGFIHQVIPFWRVYARLFLVVHAALVGMAALAVTLLIRQRAVWVQALIAIGLTFVTALEFLIFPPRAVWSFEQAPPVYEWLSMQNDLRTVAEYPIWKPPYGEAYNYLTWQYIHGKRLFNSSLANGPNEELRDAAIGLGDPQALPLLRELGVQAVVAHTGHIPGVTLENIPGGLRLIRRFGDIWALEVLSGPKANCFLVPKEGFYPPEAQGWNSYRWMRHEGVITIGSRVKNENSTRVHFTVDPYDVNRVLAISQGETIVWRGEVSRPATIIEFQTQSRAPLVLHVAPAAARGPGTDTRTLSIAISQLQATC